MPPTSEFGDQFTRSGGSDPEKGVTNGENDRFRANIQKTLEIEQVFVPSQYLVGAGNHIYRTPNALKTS